MKIAIVGAGAVGGYLAGMLARAGREVSIVARGAHLDAIQARGLRVQTRDERFEVRLEATDDPMTLALQDIVILTVKTPALPAVASRLASVLRDDTPVLHALNGVFWWYAHAFQPRGIEPDTRRLDPDGVLQRTIGAERSLGMIIRSPNEVIEPGLVRNNGFVNRFWIGDPERAGSLRESAAVDALSGCGFEIGSTPDIRAEMWRKLALNISSGPLAVLTGTKSKRFLEDTNLRAIARELMHEALAVAASHGFKDLGLDVEDATEPSKRPEHVPSLLQDLQRGRPMEIDTMVRAVHDFARQSEVSTPTLDRILPMLLLRAQSAGCYDEREIEDGRAAPAVAR